jgi:hypothetical protein
VGGWIGHYHCEPGSAADDKGLKPACNKNGDSQRSPFCIDVVTSRSVCAADRSILAFAQR